MHSGYDEENIDRDFIKIAKMKRKKYLEINLRKGEVGQGIEIITLLQYGILFCQT